MDEADEEAAPPQRRREGLEETEPVSNAIGHPGWLVVVVIVIAAIAGVDMLVRDVAGLVKRRRR